MLQLNCKISKNILLGLGVIGAISCSKSSKPAERSSSAVSASSGANASLADETSGTNSGDSDEVVQVYSKESLVTEALKFQKQLNGRKKLQLLDRERDRQSKLSSELNATGQIGCFAEQEIEKFEIRISGTWLGLQDRGRSSNNRISSKLAHIITYQFADDIKFSNDEKKKAIFTPSGRMIQTKDMFTNETTKEVKRIKDIKYIKIIKGGVQWDNVEECENNSGIKSVFGSDRECKTRHYEVDALQLDSVKILINGETLYQSAGLNGKLRYQNFIWDDPAFSLNPAYIKMMQRTDCPQKEN